MKKLILSLFVLLSVSILSIQAQNDSIARAIELSPEIIEQLSSDQLLELAKEKQRLKQEHETAMAEKFGVNAQDLVKDMMPSEFTIVLYSIIFFAFLISLIIVPFYFNQLKSKMRYNLLSKLVDKNKEIPSELLIQNKKIRSDLHKSIILISVGIGIGIFLYLLNLEKSYWTIGLIPTIIGIGYLISFVLEKKNEINS
jgi:hypothetical protein